MFTNLRLIVIRSMRAPKFDRGHRIRVAEDYHWAQHVIGTVEADPIPKRRVARGA
jgi:hypothetical protein